MKGYFRKYIRMPGRTSLLKGQRGVTLIETLIAIAILGLVSAGFLAGLQTSSQTLISTDEKKMAQNLAVSQMENVMGQAYSTSYTPSSLPSEYTDYSVEISTDAVPSKDTDIQEIRVTVSHQGRPIILSDNCTLMDWKVK